MNAANAPDVLVAGDLFADLVMSGFEAWPRPGEEVFAKRFHKEIGGGAAITASGLGKLGIRVGVVGVVGSYDGQWVKEQLRAQGVDTSTIRVSVAEPTAITISVSRALDRTFFTYNGANRELPALLATLIGNQDFHSARHIHLAHAMDPEKLPGAFESLKNNGRTLSVDVGWHPEWYADKSALAALKLVDIFFPNEREGEAMTGEKDPWRMLKAIQIAGLRRVAMKLGRNGAALMWDGDIVFQEASAIEPVDTTGAGDCFDAGFLYGWLHGMEPKRCLRTATACGEMSTLALGGIAGFPGKEELETILCNVK